MSVALLTAASSSLFLAGCANEVSEPSARAASLQMSSKALTSSEKQPAGWRGEGVGDPGGGLYSVVVTSPTVRRDLPFSNKNKPKPGPAPAIITPTQRVLNKMSTLPADTPVTIFVRLAQKSFDFGRFRRSKKSDIPGVLQERLSQLQASQASAAAKIKQLGGNVMTKHWVVNGLVVELPAGAVPKVRSLKEVTELQLVGDVVPGAAYTGTEVRDRTLLQSTFLDHGIDGDDGGLAGGNIRLGIIESNNYLAWNHVGWLDWGGGPSRLIANKLCSSTGCSPTTVVPTTATHGTAVTWVAAGSIQQGQDSNFPGANTSAQQARSGIAREADIYYYNAPGGAATVKAIEDAIVAQMDVINMSTGVSGCGVCDVACNLSGINTALKNALQAGIVPVGCGGNTGHSGGCTAWYPGYLPYMVSVNGLDTGVSSTVYDNASVLPSSSKGGLQAIRHDGATGQMQAGIDLSAPGAWTNYFTTGPSSYSATTTAGCSMAAPVVSGATALLREAFWTIGWSTTDAHMLMVNLFLAGDRWDFGSNTELSSGLSDYSGLGRIHMHYPSSTNLTAPWYWEWQRIYVANGATVSWQLQGPAAESSSLTQLKWVVAVIDTELTAVPDIDLEVWDTCPTGGGSAVQIAADYSLDLKSRVVLDGSQIGGKCLEMRIKGYSVSSAGQWVYSALYNHSGAIADN